jgi:predicted Zn-dependent protease
MKRTNLIRAIAVLTTLVLTASCATTRLPPISSAGETFTPARDERRLWEQARGEEEKLLEEFEVYRDPLLVDYLGGIVSNLNPSGMADNPEISYRVTVLENPTLNAFAYPHGSLYIHTGLLARMENEDQIATVLGHEMSHVESRHMLRWRRSARNKQIGFLAAAVVGAVILAGEQGEEIREGHYGKAARIGVLSDLLLGLGLQLAFVAAVNGYGRDLEREADLQGFEKMTRAGYDTREAEKVYTALLEDHGESGAVEGFFFGSHPQLAKRVESAREWATGHVETDQPAATGDPEEFRRRIRPVIRDDARMNLEIGRLKLAEDQLLRVLEMMPEDPEVHLLLGTLNLKKAENDKDEAASRQLRRDAMESFREAIRLDPERPDPHLELGLLAYRLEDYATACTQFRHFLEIDPASDQAPRIRDYILELERDGLCTD